MTPEEWHKIKSVLATALELDEADRRLYLDSACAGQTSMRSEVESLLKCHEEDDAFLEQPAAVEAADLIASTPGVWTGRRFGQYELLEQIGEGGMGAVYRAVRADGLYDKQVAIKLMRSGLSTDFFVVRFKNERQILAGLEHPNIARLLDGGFTEEGLPYVVLEFIAGTPIDEYCARHGLSIVDRLKLFRTVCSAVQYAHQNLVVHRDLKPGNILVTEDGVPKLLDFGIAKILDPERERTARDQTLTVMRIMTPDFASPEQVRGNPVTTASDVYSLGVILYLLLTGRSPYHVPSTAPHEMIKAICDTDPEKPSTAVTRLEKDSSHVGYPGTVGEQKGPAAKREKLRRVLSGDLDNVVLKALRKEPERRYATVEQFSEDVRRHLEHLPVIARRDTPTYRTAKFILRHKVAVAAAAAVALTLIAGLLITVREERIAERRFNELRTLANSLIFDVHDSIKDLPGSTPARKLIVDRALQYLNGLSQESREDVSLQRELATAYERVGLVQGHYLQNSLGDTQGSLISYQKALQLRRKIDAKSSKLEDHLALAQAYRLVANQQWALGDYSRAGETIAAAVAISERLNGAHSRDLKILKEIGSDYEVSAQIQSVSYAGGGGDSAKVNDGFRKAVATDETVLAISPDDPEAQHAYATDLNHLAGILGAEDNSLAALECYKKELTIDQKLRERSPEARYARGVAVAYSYIGLTYDRLGDFPSALDNLARGLEISQELVRADPKNTLFQKGLAIAYANTAQEMSKVGRHAQTFGYIEKSEHIMRDLAAADPANKNQRGYFAALLATNASTRLRLGKWNDALKEFDEARRIFESLKEAGNPLMPPLCTEKMAEAASRERDSKLATAYFHEVLKVVEPLISLPKFDASALYLAADSYSGLGDLEMQKARQSRGNSAEQRANWMQARARYLESLHAWHRIEHPRPVAPNGFDAGDPQKVETKLQWCEAALAKSGAPPQ
jgi:eukaryotic-like serine/threonine-protein kinase